MKDVDDILKDDQNEDPFDYIDDEEDGVEAMRQSGPLRRTMPKIKPEEEFNQYYVDESIKNSPR